MVDMGTSAALFLTNISENNKIYTLKKHHKE